MADFKRKTWVTRGADATEVVEWSDGKISVTEFQNAYMVDGVVLSPDTVKLATALHMALERAHHLEGELSIERYLGSVSDGRCPAESDRPGFVCGLPKDHDGDHDWVAA